MIQSSRKQKIEMIPVPNLILLTIFSKDNHIVES